MKRRRAKVVRRAIGALQDALKADAASVQTDHLRASLALIAAALAVTDSERRAAEALYRLADRVATSA
jgi:hypothetical protein